MFCSRAARLKRPALGRTTFIAVTGSCGKTTTTKLVRAVLAKSGACSVGDGNNTEKAAIRAVLKLPRGVRFCLQEVGADRKGTIARRVKILRPDIGIVTMVGGDHYKVFRTLEETAKEKGALVAGLAGKRYRDPQCRRSALVLAMASRTRARVMTFGLSADADVRASDVSGALA